MLFLICTAVYNQDTSKKIISKPFVSRTLTGLSCVAI